MSTVLYKRATFVTHLPVGHLYTHSHNWLAAVESEPGHWRVGCTRFALRMLGELVDVQFERQAGEPVAPGDIIGSIEGLKAISDLFCAGHGRFVQANPALHADLKVLAERPCDEGWLYEIEGHPDERAIDLAGYCNLLDVTIDRMLQKERGSKAHRE